MPEKRHDPPSRPVDGDLNDASFIVNQDPARVYMLANPNDPYCGVDAAIEKGWVVETVRKDGPRIGGGLNAKDGDQITKAGQILMSRSKEAQETHLRSVAAVADQRSRAIGQQGGVDQVRSPTGRLAHSETAEYVTRG